MYVRKKVLYFHADINLKLIALFSYSFGKIDGKNWLDFLYKLQLFKLSLHYVIFKIKLMRFFPG